MFARRLLLTQARAIGTRSPKGLCNVDTTPTTIKQVTKNVQDAANATGKQVKETIEPIKETAKREAQEFKEDVKKDPEILGLGFIVAGFLVIGGLFMGRKFGENRQGRALEKHGSLRGYHGPRPVPEAHVTPPSTLGDASASRAP